MTQFDLTLDDRRLILDALQSQSLRLRPMQNLGQHIIEKVYQIDILRLKIEYGNANVNPAND